MFYFKENYGSPFLRLSVQHDSANKMQINVTQPITNISNNNNFKIINRSVLSVSRPLLLSTNKEALKYCSVVKHFGSGDVRIFTRHTGSSKYGTTRKNAQRYCTPKRLIKCIYPQLVLHQLQPNNSF